MHTAAMRLVLLGCALGLLVASCAKHSGGQTGDEDALPSGDELFGELGKRGGTSDYEPARSLGELVGDSERVVVAHAIALRAGRTYVDGGRTIGTVVLELAVERSLKGPVSESLYLEFIAGAEDVAPPKRLPDARLVAFAEPGGHYSDDDVPSEDEGRGLPDGETLHRLTTPQGLAVANEDGGFDQPLEPSDQALGGGDFDDLIDRIEAALAMTGSDAGAAGSGGSTGDAGSAGSGGSAAGSSAPVPDAGGCPGELPFEPGATRPAPACPAGCEELRGSPFDERNTCVDYANQILIGCTEGVGPPVVVCVERPDDGARFQVGAGWPFPMSTTYRTCSDDDSTAVLSAPACE